MIAVLKFSRTVTAYTVPTSNASKTSDTVRTLPTINASDAIRQGLKGLYGSGFGSPDTDGGDVSPIVNDAAINDPVVLVVVHAGSPEFLRPFFRLYCFSSEKQ